MTKTFCDKCGKELKQSTTTAFLFNRIKIFYSQVTEQGGETTGYPKTIKDLCEECKNKFVEHIEKF